VILFNTTDVDFEVKKGDKIAQIVIAPVTRPRIEETESVDETDRGEGGFGSTGV
jgi:dUTP pyrophosphatase